MTSEANLDSTRSLAATSAGLWEGIALPADMRQAVERAAAAEGTDPLSWLARALSRAAGGAAETTPTVATTPAASEVEIARSLKRLLAAVRDREDVPTALGSEPEAPPRIAAPEPPALVRLTAERARADQEATPAQHTPRRSRAGLWSLCALLLAAFVGVALFYVVRGVNNGTREASVSMPLPRSPQATPALPAPGAAPTSASEPPAEKPSAPEPAQTSAPAATTEAPAAPPASAPATTASAPAAPSQPVSETPAPQPSAPTSPSDAPANTAPPAAPAAPSSSPAESASAPPSETAAPPETGAVGPGEALAAFRLGVRYAFGDGVAQDYQKAAEQFRIAAQQGLPDAQYNLGALYDNGLGVPRDPVRAVIWYHSAAQQGHPSAQLNLGLAYANGSGVAQDYSEAARWFRRAADQGIVTAQYNLAALYANGKGVQQSMIDAYAWFSIAAGSGDAQAKAQMQRVAATLKGQQLRDAKALAISLGQEVGRTGDPQPHNPVTPPGTSNGQPPSTSPPPTVTQPHAAADRAVVAEIQRYLVGLHYDPGRRDGQMDDQTADAIRKYESDRSINVDGEPTRTLLFRLKAEVQKQAKQ